MSGAQKIFMPSNIKCISSIITLEGNEKIKTEKKEKRQQNSLKNISFTNAVRKTAKKKIEMTSRF